MHSPQTTHPPMFGQLKVPWRTICRLVLLTSALVFLGTGCSKDARKHRHQERADNYFRSGDYSKAEVEYLNLLNLERTNGHAIRQLGVLYAESGRAMRAYPLLANALQLFPQDAELRLKLAALQSAGGAPKVARTNALIVLKQAPTNELALLLLAESVRSAHDLMEVRLHLQQLASTDVKPSGLLLAEAVLSAREGKPMEALKQARQVLTENPKSATAHHLVGMLSFSVGDLTNAALHLKESAQLSEPRSPRKIQYAEFLTKIGNLTEAKILLDGMTKAVPDYIPSWSTLAEIAVLERQITNAVAFTRIGLQKDPENMTLLLMQARLDLAQGKTETAITTLERLADRFEGSPQVHHFLAVAYAMKNDSRKALQSVNRAVGLNPGYQEAVLLQAQLNLRRENADVAIAGLKQFITSNPASPQPRLALINAYMVRRDFEAALNQCAELREYYPTNAQLSLLTGMILQQQKQADSARRHFERALELQPNALSALEQLVDLDIAANAFDSAAARVQKSIETLDDSALLQSLLAKVYIAKKDHAATERTLLRCIEMDPNFGLGYVLLARHYLETGRKDKALEQLQQTLEKNPRDFGALMMLGTLQYERGEYVLARDAYARLLELSPNFGPALNNLADIYSEKLNDLEKAYEAARKARDLFPSSPHTADTFGWILHKRGEYSWALPLLQESAEKLPQEPIVLFHLGMTYYMLANETAARSAFERALALNREFPEKDETVRRLEILAATNTTAPDALSKLEQLAEANDPIALSRLAAMHERGQAFDQAIALYERAIKRNPKNLAATVKLAELHARSAHDNAKALRYAKAARALAPDDPEIAHTLGQLAYESGDFAWSLALLQESLRKQPGNGQVLYDLALTYSALGRLSESKNAIEAALKSDSKPKDPVAGRTFFGLLELWEKDRFTDADAIEIESTPKTPSTLLVSEALRGRIQLQKNDFAGAKETYQKLLKQFPAFALCHKELALLEAMPGGDPQKAFDHALKARAAFPQDAQVAKTLGMLTYQRKDYNRAAQLLSESTAALSKDSEAWVYLGLTQRELNQRAEAQKTLRKALAMNPPAPLVDIANRALSQLN